MLRRREDEVLISCIMPTRNRRHLIGVALASFLSQTWPEKELIVLDDGEVAVEDLVSKTPGVLYLRHRGPQLSTGEKRNICCEAARGEVIAHFDDDDWSHPERLSEQAEKLERERRALVGYNRILFWDGKRATEYDNSDPTYTTGTSMFYLKSFWRSHRFPHLFKAEDNALWRDANSERRAAAVDGRHRLVARVHGSNIDSHRATGYPEAPVEDIPAAFFKAIGFAA